MRAKRLLVIEEDLEQGGAIAANLASLGAIVYVEPNQNLALDWLVDSRDDPPAVIVFYLSPPVEDSKWLLELARIWPPLSQVAFVVTTASPQRLPPEIAALCPRILPRPYTLAQLREAIGSALVDQPPQPQPSPA